MKVIPNEMQQSRLAKVSREWNMYITCAEAILWVSVNTIFILTGFWMLFYIIMLAPVTILRIYNEPI